MSADLPEVLKSALNRSDFEVIEVVPVPSTRDRMVRLHTIEEILAEFDAAPDDAVTGFFVQVRPRLAMAMAAQASDSAEHPSLLPKPSLDGIYLPNGKLNVAYLFRNADLLLETGEFTLARNIYKTILQAGERTAVALLGVARCYEGEGKVDEARMNYEESLAYNPTLDAYRRLAALLLHMGKEAPAAEIFERALNLRDLPARTRYELHKACGNCWTRAKNARNAEQHYLKALQVEPSADEMRSNLGALRLQEGKIAEARRHFQDALASNARNAKALSGLAACYLAEGDKQLAHDTYARALEADITDTNAVYQLVKCAYELKSYAAAARLTERYAQSAPVNLALLYSLAGMQFHLGRLDDASATSRRILSVQPEHTGARELMNRIGKYSEPSLIVT